MSRCVSNGQIIQKHLGHNSSAAAFVAEYAAMLTPKTIHVCDGSQAEFDGIMSGMVKSGAAIKLNETLRPNSYLTLSDPSDVARVESMTYINTSNEADNGRFTNWVKASVQKESNHELYKGAMQGRTMYVLPFSMGPLGSPLSRIGIQVTDSPLVAASMRIMTRMGAAALKSLGSDGKFVRCVHSVGMPLAPGVEDVTWPCNKQTKFISHFPEELLIESFGSGYGGNALLGKKGFALRIASYMGRKEGFLAEHMLIIGVTSPSGEKKYMAAAMPSACGKTNLALLRPSLPGWKVECIGDDIAWMKWDKDGVLRAINPEFGMFGVAPGTSAKTNPNALAAASRDAIFTNVGLTPNGDVWWEGLTKERPAGMKNWLGNPDTGGVIAQGNSRFTVAATNCPVLDPEFNNPQGVPISAIIFGGRRPTTIPLVHEAMSWEHGIFMGSSIASVMTAAAEDPGVGSIRRDPFAMRPFFGYNPVDYFQHWLDMGRVPGAKLPKIFQVNWFRENATGQFIWPGFGANSVPLAWMFGRCNAKGMEKAVETPIGYMPRVSDLELSGLDVPKATMDTLLAVDKAAWTAELNDISVDYARYGPRVPAQLYKTLESIKARVAAAK